jgi:hypothetical protein
MKNIKRYPFLSMLILFLLCSASFAAPVTSEQASLAVKGWLALGESPFGGAAGSYSRVESYGESGEAASPEESFYHVIYLEPRGIVIVPADDTLEPITAYLPDSKRYEPGPGSPAYDIVTSHTTERVKALRNNNARSASSGDLTETGRKWADLLAAGSESWESAGRAASSGLNSISDVRVYPMLMTKWAQGSVGDDESFYVYNYYTPKHYLSGCTATAMSQVMKYFSFPTQGIGVNTFQIQVDEKPVLAETRGGDGLGGPYRWNLMPEAPDASTSVERREAIGALLYDAGISILSSYKESGGTGSLVGYTARELAGTFGYSNAVGTSISDIYGGVPTDVLTTAINTNLDAGIPVILGILSRTGSGGHAVVADGYGYDYGTIYHHINVGWGGEDNLWYALPDIQIAESSYQIVDEVVYNVYTEGKGEIVSGRVVTSRDEPVAGATVTISGASFGENAASNEKGVFAFSQVPSNASFTVSASKEGISFISTSVSTRESVSSMYTSNTAQIGNVWDVTIREGTPGSGGGGGGGGCDSGLSLALPLIAGFVALLGRDRGKPRRR